MHCTSVEVPLKDTIPNMQTSNHLLLPPTRNITIHLIIFGHPSLADRCLYQARQLLKSLQKFRKLLDSDLWILWPNHLIIPIPLKSRFMKLSSVVTEKDHKNKKKSTSPTLWLSRPTTTQVLKVCHALKTKAISWILHKQQLWRMETLKGTNLTSSTSPYL